MVGFELPREMNNQAFKESERYQRPAMSMFTEEPRSDDIDRIPGQFHIVFSSGGKLHMIAPC